MTSAKQTSGRAVLHSSLAEKVCDLLREDIVHQRLRPGSRLPEEEVAEEFGVSRTPVRQALSMLVERALVEYRPRRGMFVVRHTRHDVAEVFELRELLEGAAAYDAALNVSAARIRGLRQTLLETSRERDTDDQSLYVEADVTFHDAIIEQSPNLRLARYLHQISDQIQIFRIWGAKEIGPRRSAEEHEGIVDALEDADPELAKTRMR